MPRKLTPRIKAADGTWYRLMVLKVQSTDDDRPKVSGFHVPRELEVLHDDEAAAIVGGEHFVTAYLPEIVFGKAPKE